MKASRPGKATFLFVGAVLLLAGSPAARAQGYLTCVPTQNDCDRTAQVTTSRIQIGGAGSRSSEGPWNPGRLSDGGVAEAEYQFTFDRSTGRLTVVVTNTSSDPSMLTGIFFNAPPSVTGLTLLSETGLNDWIVAYDRDRTDGYVDTHPARDHLRGDGFGLFNVFLSNNGDDTFKTSGDPGTEIWHLGPAVTFVLQVQGDLSLLTACSFTSMGSMIPPGDKITLALGRFQAGANGGSGYIGPCEGGKLVVALAAFDALAGDAAVTLAWDTASEIDNAGFAILRKDVRAGKVERLNPTLIPSQGSPVSGASYAFVDTTAVNGRRYLYALEDWDTNDVNTIHAPGGAVPNPPRPPVRLLAPYYEARAASSQRFRWEMEGRLRATLEFSPDGSFQAGATLTLPAGARTSRSLAGGERARLRDLAALGGEGGVYWRVVGRDARGGVAVSQTWFVTLD